MKCVAASGFLWGLFMCLGLGQPANGAPATISNDGKTIAECINAARQADGFAGNCIGMIADPCIKAARDRDSYVKDAKACAARELAIWLVRLRDSILIIKKNGSSEMTASVMAAQKNWESSRDKLCPVFNGLDPGAFLGAGDYCRLREAAGRVLLLERLGEAIAEH
jgi:hypothetical protein